MSEAEKLAQKMSNSVECYVDDAHVITWFQLLPFAKALIEAREALDGCECFCELRPGRTCMRCAALARIQALIAESKGGDG